MAAQKMHFSAQVTESELRLLRVFKTVVDSGGFTAAEVELNVSRSAISTSMAELEKRLGFRLCQRGRQGFALTDAGRQVYDNLAKMLGALDTFRMQINAIHSSLTGELCIGITDNLITMRRMRIVNSLQRLKRSSPDVTINIRTLPPNEIEKGVLNGHFHIGIVTPLRQQEGLEYFPLYEEESGLYCGDQHPLFTVEDEQLSCGYILSHDAVGPAFAQSEPIQAVYDRHKLSATISDREGVAFLLMTGCYIGYLPTHYAESWVRMKTFRQLRPQDFGYRTQYTAITRAGNHDNLVLNSYLKALRETE